MRLSRLFWPGISSFAIMFGFSYFDFIDIRMMIKSIELNPLTPYDVYSNANHNLTTTSTNHAVYNCQ